MKKFLLLLIFAIVFVPGCVPAEFRLRPLPENPAAPIVVAAFLPLSGNNRVFAEQMQEGLLAAEAYINRNRGIAGRKLKLRVIDTAGTAEGTGKALKKAELYGAVAAVAGYGTKEVSMLIQNADRLRMPMVIPLATSDYHTQTSPFVYRNCFTDMQQMEMLASYIHHWRKMSRGAIITDHYGDDEYTGGITRNFTQAIRDLGGKITINTIVPSDAELTANQIIELLATDPEFILVSSSGKRAAKTIAELRKSGFRGIICGPESWDEDEICENLKGVKVGECVFPAFFNPANESREFREFKKDFRKRFYHNPGACETQCFDALVFLAIGLENAGNLFEFDANWRKIVNFPGAAAYYSMGKKGTIDRTVYLKSFDIDYGANMQISSRVFRKMQYSKLKDYQIIE